MVMAKLADTGIPGENGLESQGLLRMECVMEAELARLEEKVSLLAQLCTGLREENRTLRQQMLLVEQDNLKLRQKLEGAESRIHAILSKIPEETQ